MPSHDLGIFWGCRRSGSTSNAIDFLGSPLPCQAFVPEALRFSTRSAGPAELSEAASKMIRNPAACPPRLRRADYGDATAGYMTREVDIVHYRAEVFNHLLLSLHLIYCISS